MSYVELSNPKTVTCRRTHGCEWCGHPIRQGERAVSRSYVNEDNEITRAWQHPDCWEAMEKSNQIDLSYGWLPGDQGRGCLLGGFESEGARVAWPEGAA